MSIAITSVILIALLIGLILLTKFFSGYKSLFLKCFGGALFAVYMVRLFSVDVIDGYGGLTNPLFGEVATAFLVILRWVTVVALVATIVGSFYNIKTINNIIAFFGSLVAILNIIFFNQMIIGFVGNNAKLSNFRVIEFMIEVGLLGAISIYQLISKIKNKDFKNFSKQLKYFFIVLPFMLIAVMPLSTLQILFGKCGMDTSDFTLAHRLIMYISIIAPCLLFAFLHKKDQQIKNFALVFMATCCWVTFFYTYDFQNLTWTNLPLHLCNTGVILIFIAFTLKIKSVYYFTYFVSVIGALIAMVIPNVTSDAISLDSLHFWYNHAYVLFLPVLARLLNMFEKPKLKMMRGAIIIFTIYFIAMVAANAWINSFSSVDYFFLYKDVISSKLTFLQDIRLNFIWLPVVNGVALKVFWLYDIIIYVGYIFLMFMIWLMYTYFYKIEDHYAELVALKKLDSLEIKELKKKMNGKPLNLPVNAQGVNMLKISHFSKVYGLNRHKSVDDFSLEIKEGEVFGFLGHNGAGKSTLIKSIVGIQSITEGNIEVCGYDIKLQPLQAKMNIGYVSDNHAVYENLTGREYINYVADLYLVNQNDRDDRIKKYSEMFNLSTALDQQIKSYSHGMKQKLVVIAALIHNPKIWVLDEPLTGLDPSSAYQIKECMREHANNGNIVFFSSHVIEVVEKICDRIAIIQKGKLQGVFNVKTMEQNGIDLEDLYLSFVENQHDKPNDELRAIKEKALKLSCNEIPQEKVQPKRKKLKRKNKSETIENIPEIKEILEDVSINLKQKTDKEISDVKNNIKE